MRSIKFLNHTLLLWKSYCSFYKLGDVVITKRILWECSDTSKHDLKFVLPLSATTKITTVTKLETVYAIKG